MMDSDERPHDLETETASERTGLPGPRRQRRSLETRDALIDAALHEFSAHGFEGASTRAIARRAGTHQPQINYHFASKDALWRAAVDRLFGRLDTGLAAEADPPGGSDRQVVAAVIRRFVHAVAGLPELNRMMVHEATCDSERLEWIVEHHVRRRFAEFSDRWRRLRSAGQVPDIDELIVYYTLVGGASLIYVNAPEARRLAGRDPITADFIRAHAEALVQILLGPEPSRTQPT